MMHREAGGGSRTLGLCRPLDLDPVTLCACISVSDGVQMWVTLTQVVNDRLVDEEKRRWMTEAQLQKYRDAVANSGLSSTVDGVVDGAFVKRCPALAAVWTRRSQEPDRRRDWLPSTLLGRTTFVVIAVVDGSSISQHATVRSLLCFIR